MKTTRRTVLWHPEQLKVWCSKPRTATVFSGTQRHTLYRATRQSHAGLHLAEGTVKTHLHNVYQKVRVPNRTAAEGPPQIAREIANELATVGFKNKNDSASCVKSVRERYQQNVLA